MRRYGAVQIPAVAAVLPFCGEPRASAEADLRRHRRRQAFLYAPRFSPASD